MPGLHIHYRAKQTARRVFPKIFPCLRTKGIQSDEKVDGKNVGIDGALKQRPDSTDDYGNFNAFFFPV